jgi:hypothetical protein
LAFYYPLVQRQHTGRIKIIGAILYQIQQFNPLHDIFRTGLDTAKADSMKKGYL